MTTKESLVILGRQPALGLAELESLYGADKLQPAGNEAALLKITPESVDFARLGGAIKVCSVLDVLETTKWPAIQNFLEQAAPKLAAQLPEGKMQLGLSTYELGVNPQQLLAAGLNLKKAIRKTGRSVRLVPSQGSALNSAQVLHNHLTGPTGCELVLVRDGDKTICAQTIAEQDIESYTLRDRGRPKRDARVGMLPPKLAQIIINLAVGAQQPSQNFTLLDPFCGTGVILQEALLTGFSAYGSDIESRMVDYSSTNTSWLYANHHELRGFLSLDTGDATIHQWKKKFQFVASETYLGQPFSSFPTPEKLEQVRGTCNAIIEKFLANIGRQIKPGTRLCLAVPAWQEKPGQFIHLPLLDHLRELGYNRVKFGHARAQGLIYSREGQIVGRELLVITRK
ncbi:MAG TPA: hypothetical protein VGG13_03070 [Candidatus Saccharimonadales bacterium]|jgi:tRNA (guanine10-N2)-dimethyltransferase